ncbi:MAG: Na(+)/H(+) antiporter subunit B [Chromatiaceae bacterium]|jgi:multicomponent Na+:H+ antiporter subunit B|nr:Na(+)/H(+) antiporter subunit B [Chromatiaceae bacterium]
MALAVVVLARTRNLFAVVVLSGLYSFLMATVLLALDAVDVAMTEAAVGAGVSTVLLLGALHLCKSEEAKPAHRPWLPLALASVTALVLIYGAMGLPDFADPQAPIHQHVVPRYLQNEVDVPNVVTAVLASFRGYDTLGETTVVFTAGAGIIALLRRPGRRARVEEAPPCADLLLRLIGKLLIPFVLLFALYVQFHGDYGPGGGFQAGVIFASGIVFYALIFGVENARRVMPDRLVERMIAAGVLLYLGVGVAGLLLGGNFLDYFVLDPDPVHGQHRGIFWVEVGVLITVCGVMLKIFYMFASRGRGEERG